MAKLFKYLPILALLLFSFCTSKTTVSKYEMMLCNTWKPAAYERDGQKLDPPESLLNNRIWFSLDHTTTIAENGITRTGDWQLSDDNKVLTIIDKETHEKMVIDVLKLDEDEFVFQIGNEKEGIVTVHMEPESRP